MTAVTSQAERLKSLILASQSLASIETRGEVLGRLMTLAQEVTGAEASSVLLYNREREVLEFSLAANECLSCGQAGQCSSPLSWPWAGPGRLGGQGAPLGHRGRRLLRPRFYRCRTAPPDSPRAASCACRCSTTRSCSGSSKS